MARTDKQQPCVQRRLKDLMLQVRDGDPEVFDYCFPPSGRSPLGGSDCQQCKWLEILCECPGGGLNQAESRHRTEQDDGS